MWIGWDRRRGRHFGRERTDQGRRERGNDGSEEPKKAYVWYWKGDGGKLAVRVDGVLFAKGNARSESRGLGGERGRSMMMRYHKDYSVSH
jgi:hypothetical protein